MKLLYVPEKLTNLIRFGLPTTFLEIERARGAGMFVNVMTAADSVQPIAKGFDDLAKILQIVCCARWPTAFDKSFAHSCILTCSSPSAKSKLRFQRFRKEVWISS